MLDEVHADRQLCITTMNFNINDPTAIRRTFYIFNRSLSVLHCCSCFKHHKKIIYCTYPIKTNAIVCIAVGLIIWLIVWYRTRSFVSTETPLKILTQHNAAQDSTTKTYPILFHNIFNIKNKDTCNLYLLCILLSGIFSWYLKIDNFHRSIVLDWGCKGNMRHNVCRELHCVPS